MRTLLLNDVFVYNLTVAELVFYFFNTTVVVTLASLCVILYTVFRPKLPARVNCWFCNRSFWVPYTNRNCFDCPYCDQYNGFDKDGDYNEDVLLRRKRNEVDVKVSEKEATNGLCSTCNANQQLKVQQLADFTPMSDDNYDAEIQHFKEQLEKCYRLCDECSLVVTQTLQTQHYEMLTQRLNGHCRAGPQTPSVRTPVWDVVRTGFHAVSTLCLTLVFASAAVFLSPQFGLDTKWIPSGIPQILCMSSSFWWLGYKSVSALGAAACSGMFAASAWGLQDKLCLSAWVPVLALSWTSCPTLLLLFSTLALGLHIAPFKQVKSKPNVFVTPMVRNKAVPLSGVVNNSLNRPKEVTEVKTPVPVENPKKQKTPTPVETAKEVPRRIETRSQKKREVEVSSSKRGTLEEKRTPVAQERSRLFSPPPEVYKGLSSLRLGSVEPQLRDKPPDKPSNYLFETINFGRKKEKCLIKPAKFSLSSNHSFHDNMEPSRRSSTPSSQDAMSDLNISALSPLSPKFSSPGPYHVDYDYTPYSPHPGYLAPIGHTAVYTFSRPAPYPYSFAPQRFSPPYTSPCEPPFSHTLTDMYSGSHSGNSSFSSLQTSQKWVWLKRGLYGVSVFLNLLTVVFLAFSFLKS